jgi:localization factor PodJL
MSAGAPWSVKGIDPKAREVAKDLARRSGMTLGEWLNRVILEDDIPEEISSQAHFAAARSRLDAVRMPAPSSISSFRPAVDTPNDLGRIATALDRLTDRIEASETRTGLAISGVEHSVRHAMARIETAEREHMSVAARFDASAERLDAEQARAAERLRRMENETSGPRSVEALKALEQSVTRVAAHLYEGESRNRDTLAALDARIARAEALTGGDPTALIEEVVSRLGARLGVAEGHTTDALESLRGSLAALDNRMRSFEGGARPDLDQRLEALADQLTQRVEDARNEIAARLVSAGPGQVEARLGEITRQIEAVEQRSALAIEAMGREVLTMAETLNRRVQSAEQRSAEAIEQVGGEIARIAGAVENRLGRVDQLHAEALERLGTEIGRITDRLTDRLIQSERRAAQAIDDVGEQVSKVTERIEQRHERASTDLAERIRQSEERTAAMLEAARAGFGRPAELALEPTLEPAPEHTQDPTWASTAQPADLDDAPDLAEAFIEAVPPADEDSVPSSAAFGPELMSRAEPISPPALDPVNPAFGQEDFEAADSFAPIAESVDEQPYALAPDIAPETDADTQASSDLHADAQGEVASDVEAELEAAPQPNETQLSTREVIEQARAAARAVAASARPKILKAKDRPVRMAYGGGLFGAMKRRPPSTWQTALMVAGGAAFLSVGAAGVVLLEGPGARSTAKVTQTISYPPRAAVAISPGATVGGAATPAIAPAAVTVDDYTATVRAVAQGQAGALGKLKALADADNAAAQVHLAKLYETGQSGVAVNLAEARRWTTRAAEGGDPSAMHNLALYYFRGEGGAQNTAGAAQWFRRAAERGVLDSQYNLGLLYQSGSGVARDLAEAYKWFAIAARTGDSEAQAKMSETRSRLGAAQIAAGDAAAAAFAGAEPTRAGAAKPAPAASVASAQRILGRLGYYKGQAGVAPNRDLEVAVANYQRDQGLAATGALDASTMARLSVFAP